MAKRFTGRHGKLGPGSVNYTVDIYDADFSGSATEFLILTPGVEVYFTPENEEFRHAPIIGTKCTFTMAVPVGDATLEAFVGELSTRDERSFYVEVLRVGSSTPIFRGILLPDLSAETDEAVVFGVPLTAVDGLSFLKTEPYYITATKVLYDGFNNLTGHLVTALKKLPHTSFFWSGSEPFLRTSVDWWADIMTASADNDPLFLANVDHTVFYQFFTKGGTDKDVLSCYDVVSAIMTAMGCRIKAYRGAWWVEQIPYRSATSYTQRNYDVNAGFLNSTTISGVNEIDQTINGAKLSTADFDYLPQIKQATITYKSKVRRNIFNNILLTMLADTHTFNQNISSNSGEVKFRVRGTIFVNVKNDSYSGGGSDVLYLTMGLSLKLGDNYLKRTVVISNFTAQLSALSWTASAGDKTAIPISVGTVPPIGITSSGVAGFDFITPSLPSDADANTVSLSVQSLKKWDGTDVSTSQFTITWTASSMWIEAYDNGTPDITEDDIDYRCENPDGGSETYDDLQTLLGGATTANSIGRLFNQFGVNYAQWGEGTGTRDKNLGQLVVQSIVNGQLVPTKRINAAITGNLIDPNKLIETLDGKQWFLQRGKWSLFDDTISGSWIEMNYGSGGVLSSPVKIKKVLGPNGPTYPPVEPTTGNLVTSTAPGFYNNPPPTVLAPVSFNALDGVINDGDVVTSIPIKIASLGVEFLEDDGVTLVNPMTGVFQTFIIATAPELGDVAFSIKNTTEFPNTSAYEFPEDSYLVVKQNAYSFRPKTWKTYKGVVASNSVAVPLIDFVLPTDYNDVLVIIRRQTYLPSDGVEARDFSLNAGANSVDFQSSLGLNGQTAYIRAFVK